MKYYIVISEGSENDLRIFSTENKANQYIKKEQLNYAIILEKELDDDSIAIINTI